MASAEFKALNEWDTGQVSGAWCGGLGGSGSEALLKSTPGNKQLLRGVLESHEVPWYNWIYTVKCGITEQTQSQANKNISFGVWKICI